MNDVIHKIMTPRQSEIADDFRIKKPRHIILHGSIRSGKTYEGILLWNTYVKRHEGENKLFIMTGHTISSLKRNVLDDLEKLFGVDTHLNINNEFTMYGNQVACFGTDKADSYKTMRGLTSQGWYANEVIFSHQNSVLEAFARCSEPSPLIVWETNPDKPTHYIKTDYIDKSGDLLNDGSYNILAYHFELEDNTFLDKNYIESLKISIPSGTVYDRQIKGLWRATDKAIYTNTRVVDMIPQKIDDDCFAIDFGFVNPCSMVRIMWYEGEPYIKACFQKTKLTESDLISNVSAYIENKDIPLYCDSAEPDKIQALRNAGFNAREAKKDVLPGIRKVQETRLNLIRDKELVQAIENYEFQKNSRGEVLEVPLKYNDHYPDAVRYGIYTHNYSAGGGDIAEIEEIEDEYEV